MYNYPTTVGCWYSIQIPKYVTEQLIIANSNTNINCCENNIHAEMNANSNKDGIQSDNINYRK